jgi:hypothetical protein
MQEFAGTAWFLRNPETPSMRNGHRGPDFPRWTTCGMNTSTISLIFHKGLINSDAHQAGQNRSLKSPTLE